MKFPENPPITSYFRALQRITLDMQDTLGISEHILTKYFSDINVRYVTHRHKGDRRIESPWRGGFAPLEKTSQF